MQAGSTGKTHPVAPAIAYAPGFHVFTKPVRMNYVEEVIVGCSRGGLGPLMMFGLGGTFVELIKDVQFRLAPMWKVTAEEMVRSIKAFKKLDGFRGAPKRDINTVVDVILRMSAMVVNNTGGASRICYANDPLTLVRRHATMCRSR
jgi:hypothetical protein